MTMWYVCDMDTGVLRVEPTRKAAKRWAEEHFAAPQLTSRKLGRSRYEYGYGFPGEDHVETVFIMMGYMILIEDGFAPYPIAYPYPDDPHTEATNA